MEVVVVLFVLVSVKKNRIKRATRMRSVTSNVVQNLNCEHESRK